MKKISKIILLSLIAIVVILLYKWSCNKPIPLPPDIKTVTDQKAVVVKDSVAMRHVVDSMVKINIKLDKALDIADNNIKYLAANVTALEKWIDELLVSPVPDTCKHIVAALTDKFGKLKTASANKDAEANKRYANLWQIRKNLDGIIKEKDKGWAKIRGSLDTCWAQQKKLEDYVKKVSPKRGIYAGITAIGNTTTIYGGIGVNFGLMNRKGTMWEVGAIQMQGVTQYTIGVRTRLFKF